MIQKIFVILFVSIIGAGLLAALWLWSYAVRPGSTGGISRQAAGGAEDTIMIPPGTGLRGIRAILAEAGTIEDDVRFVLLARLLDISHRLQAGEYHFAADATPVDILRQLEAGRIVRWPVTIPEGASLFEIAAILSRGQWVDRERFLALVRDPHFTRTLGVEADTLEGYLFPETYYLSRGQSPEEIVRMMVAHLRAVIAELCPESNSGVRSEESEFRMEETEHRTQNTEHRKQNTENGTQLSCPDSSSPPFNLHELLTLASIVEKETGRAEERHLIACVFLNRLRQGMRLQADPTVIYGIDDFDGNLTRRHLRSDSPYNTYKIKGLPPTPIANPGRAAIEAVLRPAPEPYLYFVSRNDGSHQFSATLKEHNRAVAQFQKGLRKAARDGR
jgi:UPF0755 protein